MLYNIRNKSTHDPISNSPCRPPEPLQGYDRDMQEDMKTAIELLFKFKAGLDKLHPECFSLVQAMLTN